MCVDPISLLTATGGGSLLSGIATAASVVGGAISAVSQYQNARVMAATAEANAEAQEAAALRQLQRGEEEGDRVRRRAAQVAGDATVAMAANGIDVSSSEAIGLLGETLTLGEEDAFAARENSRFAAENNAIQAANFRNDASSARSQSVFQPVRTILGTASTVASRWDRFRTAGADFA